MSSGYSSLGADVSGSVPVCMPSLIALGCRDLSANYAGCSWSGAHGLAIPRYAGPIPELLICSFELPDSNLQTFPPNDARGKLTGSSKPPRDADDTFSRLEEPEQFGWHGYFSLLSYRPYFNVDTSDVLQRIFDSLYPLRSNFVEKTSSNPDMYGPFWICTTLIFVTAALGNFAAYLAHKTSASGDTHWHYDINKVTWSAGLFYGYVGGVPLGLYLLLRYLGVTTTLVQLWCLYGYSLFIFIPTSFLTVIPVDNFKWAIVAVAAGLSATFLALNMRSHIRTASERWLLIVSGCFLLQLGLGLLVKLYFFTVQF